MTYVGSLSHWGEVLDIYLYHLNHFLTEVHLLPLSSKRSR